MKVNVTCDFGDGRGLHQEEFVDADLVQTDGDLNLLIGRRKGASEFMSGEWTAFAVEREG